MKKPSVIRSFLFFLTSAFAVFPSLTFAGPLFHCTVTRVLDPNILGESLDTEEYSNVSGIQEGSTTEIVLGAMLFRDGEYGFVIKKTVNAESETVYTVEHTKSGLKFKVHLGNVQTGEGKLSIQGKTDSKELVYALMNCDH